MLSVKTSQARLRLKAYYVPSILLWAIENMSMYEGTQTKVLSINGESEEVYFLAGLKKDVTLLFVSCRIMASLLEVKKISYNSPDWTWLWMTSTFSQPSEQAWEQSGVRMCHVWLSLQFQGNQGDYLQYSSKTFTSHNKKWTSLSDCVHGSTPQNKTLYEGPWIGWPSHWHATPYPQFMNFCVN